MMMPGEKSSRMNNDDFGSLTLLHDIEEISKALYLHKAPPKTSSSKYVKDDLLLNEKKSSIWKWKPLKALTHIRNHRLSCSFFLHIHSIEGLPPNFNDLNLCVYWKRKNECLRSQSVRVKEGVAEFKEMLIHHCSVCVNKHDVQDNVAKYAPKLSLLYASIVGAPNLDIGKHWVDLTRLLPLTLTELEDEGNRYGKWITSFKLTGKAKGATMNVSFGFLTMADSLINKRTLGKGKSINGMLQRVESIPSHSRSRTHLSNSSFDMKGPSISLLYELLDDAKTDYSEELSSLSNEVDDDDDGFPVLDKGIEYSKSVESSFIETINVAELFDDEVFDDTEAEPVFDDSNCKEDTDVFPEESNEDVELFLQNLSISEKLELNHLLFHENQFLENDYDMKNEASCGGGKMVKSHSLDDLTNNVVHDFMNFVSFDGEPDPESPRERLLKQFEEETLASGNFILDLDVNKVKDQNDCSNIFDSSFSFEKPNMVHDDQTGPSLLSRRKAKMLENLETKTLMEKWGLNETAFQNSPRTDSGAFGSPVYLSPERTPELPSLGDGLGPYLKTESGGFLRSMNPLLFKRASNGEKLVLQVSSTVVLPPAMGSNGMDILVKWATLGTEKMLSQMNSLMPLEVITGRILQHAAWKAESQMPVIEREGMLLHESSVCSETDSEQVSLSNIIPLTIEKIQYLSIEGLRIQSGISAEEPPSTVNSTSTDCNNIEELIKMSIPLEDWIKYDSASSDVKSEVISSYKDCGNIMLALQMLLRDPLRDYEHVGIPMLALIQLEKSMSVDPMFKVNEVHVAGLKANFQKKQQSGSRWLHSSGMTGKTKRHTLTKSTALVKSSRRLRNKMIHEDTLWSISSYVNGDVDRWKELSGLKLYVRNPDIAIG